MFLPLGDSPNPRAIPFVTYGIIAVNALIYALVSLPLSFQPADPSDPAFREYLDVIGQHLPPGTTVREVLNQITMYDLYVFTHAFRPAEPSIWTLFASMFLHSGFMHLFGNMLFLWIYGDNVEHRLGHAGYLFWYLVTGVAATAFQTAFAPGSELPMLGASGAISGVLGFYFIWFPHNRVRLWVFLFPILMNVIHLPARIVLGFYLFLDNVLPFLISRGSGGGVAYGAHIGGFVAGLIAAWVIDRREVTARPAEYRSVGVRSDDAPMPTDEISDAIGAGRFLDASRSYFALPNDRTRKLLSPSDSLALASWLAENGHPRAALVTYQRHLRDYPMGPGAADAHVGAGLLQLKALNQPTAAYQHFVDALSLDPSPETAAVARDALRTIASGQKFQVGRQAI